VKLLHIPKFLTDGKGTIPKGYRAVGIHPSSEVCLLDVNGFTLGVGGLVPLHESVQVKALHNPIIDDQIFGTGNNNLLPADGVSSELGDQLVLQLYEACDPLVPPGPRVPYYKDVRIAAADIGVTAELAKLAMRVPFHGRAACAVAFKRITIAADLNVIVVGRSYGRRNPNSKLVALGSDFTDQGGVWHEMAAETWWNGGGAAAAQASVEVDGNARRWRQIVCGGEADASEAFDELVIYVWGAAGGDAWLTAEAYGERTH